jgi:polycomb protein EED
MAELKEAQREGRPQTGEHGVPKPSWLKIPPKKRGPKTTSATSAAATAAAIQAVVGDGTSSLRSFAVSATGDKDSAVSSPDPENVTAPAHSKETLQAWDEMYDLSDPSRPVKAHRVVPIDGSNFVGRQAGWSPEGDWCVVVGNGNRALLYKRWGKEKGVAIQMD